MASPLDADDTHLTVVIGEDAPARLDKALAQAVPEAAALSRSRLMKMIGDGDVFRDGQAVTDPKTKVAEGQSYVLRLAPVADLETLAEDIPLSVIWEDGDLIVIDFGTATTFDVVDYSGAYKGGIIAPGINLSLDALVAAAAKLPKIAIAPPESRSVIGRTTEAQMHIGVFWGYVGLIESLIKRIRAEYGEPMKVVATGGLANVFKDEIGLFDAIEPDLMSLGLLEIWRRNRA